MNFVIAITGPTGAGKSTVAEKLAKQLTKCVNIDADHIKHMIVSGFYKDPASAGGWGFNEWGLVGDSIGLLAKNFLKEGYSVVINGYLDEPAWSSIPKHVELNHKILLLPDADAVEQRDARHREDVRMGSAVVKEHYAHFSSGEYYKSFTKLDTTYQLPEETVNEILEILT